MMYTYNATYKPIILREYGRNIQKLVEALVPLKDPTEKAARAQEILKLMALLGTHNKQGAESVQKRWNDLFILSGYSLEVDSPYPRPEKKFLDKKSQQWTYAKHPISFKHYGRKIELLIEKAVIIQDLKEKEKMVVTILRLMKRFSDEWKNDNVNIDTLFAHLTHISGNRLSLDIEKLKAKNIFSVTSKTRSATGRLTKGSSKNKKGA